MPDLPTRLDLFAIGRNYIRQRARKIDPEQVDIIGSDANLFVGSTSYIAREVVNQIVSEVASLLLDSSEKEYLDRYAWDRYQLPRKGASAAYGVVTFYRDSLVGGAGSVPLGTVVKTKTGIEYITTSTATFSVSAGEAQAWVKSVQAGRAQQAGANAIRLIDNPKALWDPSLKVNNAEPTAHAEDAESDPVFRERIRGFWSAARRGTLGAIAYGARRVAGVESANAVEALTPEPNPARVVNLYVADSSGIASQAIASQVMSELMDWRAAGITVIVYTCSVQTVPVVLKLTFNAGVVTAPVVERIRATTVETINKGGANETLLRGSLFAMLEMFKSAGLIPTQDTIVEPAGDVVPAQGKTLRTTINDVVVL